MTINSDTKNHTLNGQTYHSKMEPGNIHEPLAIVGVGLRLPGGIHTTEDLWSLLVEKKSTRCKIPKDRFNSEAFYSKSGRVGATGTEYAHFLAESDNLQHMDTSMFSMGREDTKALDPQIKMLMEVVYECMQNAGQGNWRGKNTGCFVGVFGEVSNFSFDGSH